MLFSNEEVSQQINANFEAVWVSVRPVPTVTIDFGNGEVVKRTLHGNVATYVCNADGAMLDVLPGIYEPKTYQQRLEDFVQLHEFVNQESRRGHVDVLRRLREYHSLRVRAIEQKASVAFELYERQSIVGIERGVLISLNPATRIQARGQVALRSRMRTETDSGMGGKTELTSTRAPQNSENPAEWESLASDTELNETQRRLMIHRYLLEYLAENREAATPEAIKKWIYREVLHADLDDPHLGLGKILFDNYPFAEEDRQ